MNRKCAADVQLMCQLYLIIHKQKKISRRFFIKYAEDVYRRCDVFSQLAGQWL